MNNIMYTAPAVPLIIFSHNPDSTGWVIPPEAYVYPTDPVYVLSSNREDTSFIIGTATIYRLQNKLYAGIEFTPTSIPTTDGIDLIKDLYVIPVVEVCESYEKIVTHLKIRNLFLSENRNSNTEINPLGEYLWCPKPDPFFN